MKRTESIKRAAEEEFDICIIGGGITGAGLLAAATERGYKTVLIEKNDFASGTSSRSSKLIHGGLRYLQYMQFKLVYEALQERSHLLAQYPHLVKPVPFLLPSFKSKTDLLIKDLGISLYDFLAGKSIIPHHEKLNAKQVLEKLPGMKADNLKGGIYFWDASTNDARLTVEVLQQYGSGNNLVLNYTEAHRFDQQEDEITAVHCIDTLRQTKFTIRAKKFMNATGVWTDELLNRLHADPKKRMKPTKGVHVCIPSSKLPANCVAVVTSKTGIKRFLYTLPWENNLTILGATDTDYNETCDKVESTAEDVKYVLDAFNDGFPEARITKNDIVCVFAGLRPLLAADNATDNYSRSREYEIWWSKPNFLNIAGGKLTSFLSMGNHAFDVLEKKFGKKDTPPAASTTQTYKGYWYNRYGNQGHLIEDIVTEDPDNGLPAFKQFDLTNAEIIYFVRHQFAQQVCDVLTRRTSITYAMKNFDDELIHHVARVMAKELQKDSLWVEMQTMKYRMHWMEYHPDLELAS